MGSNKEHIILYHGSGSQFSTFDLGLCRSRLDFGRGLYLTYDKDRAKGMAGRKSNGGQGYLYTYMLKASDVRSLIKVDFKMPSLEWVDFVLLNRTAPQEYQFDYDIVIGPTADDRVIEYIRRYTRGAFGLPGSITARQALLKMLKPEFYARQICLHTQRAVDCAKLVSSETV